MSDGGQRDVEGQLLRLGKSERAPMANIGTSDRGPE